MCIQEFLSKSLWLRIFHWRCFYCVCEKKVGKANRMEALYFIRVPLVFFPSHFLKSRSRPTSAGCCWYSFFFVRLYVSNTLLTVKYTRATDEGRALRSAAGESNRVEWEQTRGRASEMRNLLKLKTKLNSNVLQSSVCPNGAKIRVNHIKRITLNTRSSVIVYFSLRCLFVALAARRRRQGSSHQLRFRCSPIAEMCINFGMSREKRRENKKTRDFSFRARILGTHAQRHPS